MQTINTIPTIFLHPHYQYFPIIKSTTNMAWYCKISHHVLEFLEHLQLFDRNYPVPGSILRVCKHGKACSNQACSRLLMTQVMHSAKSPLYLCTVIIPSPITLSWRSCNFFWQSFSQKNFLFLDPPLIIWWISCFIFQNYLAVSGVRANNY